MQFVVFGLIRIFGLFYIRIISFFLLQFLLVRKVLDYLASVKLELTKVTWPKKGDVIKLTSIIFLISGVVAVYLGALDYTLTKLFEALIVN